jgi:hypothetical protein
MNPDVEFLRWLDSLEKEPSWKECWLAGRASRQKQDAELCRSEKRKWLSGNLAHAISDFEACARKIEETR